MLHYYLPEHLLDGDRYCLWFYAPEAYPLKNYLNSDLMVFDVIADLAVFENAPTYLRKLETELLLSADIVFADGLSLTRDKQEIREDTIYLPSAVDANLYSPEDLSEPEIESLKCVEQLTKDIGFPRIGVFDVIDKSIDVTLLTAIADNNPRWHLIMAGPVANIDPATLPQRDNIHWLGIQPYHLIPRIMQTCDVCILPFVVNDTTKFYSLGKVVEYLAAEKPIVTTQIFDVIELFGDVVKASYNHGEFINHIDDLLREEPVQAAERIAKGNTLVANYSWDETSEKAHQALEMAFALKFAQPD